MSYFDSASKYEEDIMMPDLVNNAIDMKITAKDIILKPFLINELKDMNYNKQLIDEKHKLLRF